MMGVIIGLLLATLTLLIAVRYQPQLNRTLRQTESKAKPKGSLEEPESEELNDWLEKLPKEY